MPDVYVLMRYGYLDDNNDVRGVYSSLERAQQIHPELVWENDRGDWVATTATSQPTDSAKWNAAAINPPIYYVIQRMMLDA